MSKKSVFQEKNSKQLPGDYRHTSMVSHRGTVVSFGMNDEGRINYAVLDLSSAEATVDNDAWSDINEVGFPAELSQTGYAIIKNYQMPVRGRANQLLTEEEQQFPVLVDSYHSTTAKLSASAPFQVISDGKYIYLFRQAKAGDHNDVDKIDSTTAVVNNTLLVDRFVLAGTRLQLSREIRYQRSGHKTQPASRKDTLSAEDIENKPFYEPTQELGFVANLSGGGFSILRIPTKETEVSRWQIFYYDSVSKKINSVSLKTDDDGWFDPTNSVTFIEQFMTERSLHSDFIEKVVEQVRDQADDDSIAATLKGDGNFSSQLADVEVGELAEVVYAIRTGVVKDDFALAGNYEVETGMSSIFYYQQEPDADSGKPMKSKASVMLAMGLKPLADGNSYIAVLNFSVSAAGQLSRLSTENLQLPTLDLASIDKEALLSQITAIEDDNVVIRNVIDARRTAYIDDIATQTGTLKSLSRPATSKAITDAMISPWHNESQVYQHTTNLTVVNQAISDTNNRHTQYQNALNTLNSADAGLQNEVIIAGENALKNKIVSANNRSFELSYKCKKQQSQSSIDKSLNQFVYDDGTYKYGGAGSLPNIAITDAPADTDWSRWAMLHDGTTYRLYFFKADSSNTLYQFSFNSNTNSYQYGYNSTAQLSITGVPADADSNSFAMLHDGVYRLYMRSISNANQMYQFTYSSANGRYEYYGSLSLNGFPSDADWSRWGMMHDGSDYRLYVMQNNTSQLYQGAWNGNVYQYGHNSSNFLMTGNPSDFPADGALLHDGSNYRLYTQKRTSFSGQWNSNSAYSTQRSNSYCQLYSFTVHKKAAKVRISLESSTDTYLHLLKDGAGYSANDDGGAGYNSLINATNLPPGNYTIEATTYGANATGSFTLTVDGDVSVTETANNLYAELLKDDRPTLTQLAAFEANPVLYFYQNLIKPKLEELKQNQHSLNDKQQQIKTGISSIPMPIIEVDDDALTTSGGLLSFAYTADKPFLFDDSLGRVSLFFRGKNENFFAAYFNPNIARYVSCEPQAQTGLDFKPRLTTDLNVDISVQSSGNTCNLLIKDVQNALTVVEQWQYLPTDSVKVARILNGDNRLNLGYIAIDYQSSKTSDNPLLTIACSATNAFMPTMDLAGLSAESGTTTALTTFLSHNRTLVAGNKRFTIAAGSNVTVKGGGLPKSSLGAIVSDPSHVDSLWAHLKSAGFIREAASLQSGAFADDRVFAGDAGAQLQAGLNLPAGLQYCQAALIALIIRAAAARQLSFEVEDANAVTVESLITGVDVYVDYDYDNFSCTPANLTGITLTGWQHHNSFVFRATATSSINMADFSAKRYAAGNAMGKWEAYHPGLAMSFDRALEVENSEGKTALLTTNQKLAGLQPTNRGLSLESWINPREIGATQTRSLVLGYRNGQSNYALGINKTADQYQCFAIIENKQIMAKSKHNFASWKHLALTYKRFWGIDFNSQSNAEYQINCGNDMSLSLDREFALELMIQPRSANATLLYKSGEYEVKLVNGKIAFLIGSTDALAGHTLTINSGEFKKVTIIRSKSKPQNINSLTDYPLLGNEGSADDGDEKWYKGKSSDEMLEGMAERQDQMYQGSQAVQQSMNLGTGEDEEADNNQYFYTLVVGTQSYTSGKRDIAPGESNFSELHLMSHFDGVFSGARIWGRGLSLDEAKDSSLSQNKTSLMAMWRFSEGQGKFIYDDAGRNHGVVAVPGFSWVDSPDITLPRFQFYIDGMEQAVDISEVAEVTSSDQFSLGGVKIGGQNQEHFDGILEEIRIWGVPRSSEEIHDNAFGRLKGEREKLLANYTFDTNFSDYKKSALADIAGLTETQADTVWAGLLDQAIITVDGAVADAAGLGGALDGLISGSDKTRIVNEAVAVFNAPAQIKDLGYNSVTLDVEGYIWGGRLGEENITQVLSTAPISDEIPAVRSALSGVATDYNDNIAAAPAIVEYGDIQENDDGTINGILKRCYSFIKDGKWHLVTGYKVGNLVAQWYGQAQFDPQVMGYLEGTPPVPAENFPIGGDADINIYAYHLDNSVELEQAEEVSYNFNTSKEAGYQVSAESEVTAGLALSFLIAPFGFGVEFAAEVGGKATTNWEHSGDRSQSFEHGTSVNREKVMGASLAGYDNGKAGAERYYKLGNTGYALVKSKTADIYLLRLQHNDALVSISWRPNPDIPEDSNIISFPINPLYVKQGSLDGKFGIAADEHYPLAQSAYGEYSYYKPTEAYRLKRQIEKEKEQAASYYKDFSTSSTDGRVKAAIAATGVQQLANMIVGYGPIINSALNQTLGQVATQQTYNDLAIRDSVSEKMSQRNLVNTYVWTVEGGFYAESTQVADTQQEVYSNDYSLSLGGELGITYKAEGGVGMEQEALFGSGSSLTVTKSKTKGSSKSFGMNVSVDLPTSPRYRYDGLQMDLSMGKRLIGEGTVDAYRFMSFYLEPQPNNYVDLFTKVIDPKWLDESPDPNANALRQARNDNKKPFCWRVMYRTTFVSRILPEFAPEAPPSLEKVMRAKNIESNYMLIKLFEPHVAHLTDASEFFTKIDLVIEQKLPEFIDYKREIKNYLELYYGMV